MKYRFDLLPDEYRSSPRDNVGIFFAIVAIIITIAAIGTTMIKNKAAFAGIDKKIAESKRELEKQYADINSKKPDATKINECISGEKLADCPLKKIDFCVLREDKSTGKYEVVESFDLV